jgi:hypothetical protein
MMRIVAAAAMCLMPLASCSSPEGAVEARAPLIAEPDVSAWQTWVLPSPDAVTPPAEVPEVSPGVDHASSRPSDGPLGARWIELAMDYVSQRTKDPPAASRAYALIAVAEYDALLAARHWSAESPGVDYGDEAAVAGAASRVLAHLFPEQPALRLDRMAEETAAQGGPEGAAGLALGRAVADQVIAYALADGSARAWDGSGRPDVPGAWSPPPGSVSPPVQPLAGAWKTWVIAAGDELRPPPPPGYGSADYLAEADELVQIGRDLTDKQKRIAKFWEGGEGTSLPPGVWNEVVIEYLREHPVSRAEQVETLALVNVALADAGVAAWDAKYAYWTTRPENGIRELLDPEWRPYLKTPIFPAYVSGHSAYSAAVAEVLAGLFPEDAERFRSMGEEAGMSRLLGGIHWRSDHTEGSRMGGEIGRRVVARARLTAEVGDD